MAIFGAEFSIHIGSKIRKINELMSYFSEFNEFQSKLHKSLKRIWKNALKFDWIAPEKAKSVPLLEFYTGLRWAEKRKALKDYKIELTSIYDLFKMIDLKLKPQPFHIFVSGKLLKGPFLFEIT